MAAKDVVGRYGEDVAARHLVEQGMQVLYRNWRCEHGEIDIVAREDECLVVCEVKTRRSTRFGLPVEAVTYRKVSSLRRLAGCLVSASGLHAPVLRIDVVSVLRPPSGPAVVEHLRGVA